MRKAALVPLLFLVAVAAADVARRASLIDERQILPSDHPAIDYWNADPTDAIAQLQQRLESGDATLAFDNRHGYLPAVLQALHIPVSSQVLVFSKTSFQAVRIVPRVPRAIYHNDRVSVGWVRGGDVVEVASLDPKLGVVFYTLNQVRSRQPRFALRTTECISCHVGPATLGVPGLMVRSLFPDRYGNPQRAPSHITDHRSPLAERWGGWYVSGKHGSQRHLGNQTYEADGAGSPLVGDLTENIEDLDPYVNPYDYLRSTSDIASLMVLEHQTRMTNLIVRLGYEARIAGQFTPEVGNASEELLRYMLFTDEAPLDEPLSGAPEFVRDFEAAGRRDKQGRSLRQLQLHGRLMRYPCSDMIHSEALEALPAFAKDRLYRRLHEVLTGQDQSPEFQSLSTKDRRAILEILRDTKTDLPAYW